MKIRASIAITLGLTLILHTFYMKQQYETEKKMINVSGCDCERYANTNNINLEDSIDGDEFNISKAATCSETAKSRGKHQKVITFSYYEKNPRMKKKRLRTGIVKDNLFLEGFQINVDLLQKFYPGK